MTLSLPPERQQLIRKLDALIEDVGYEALTIELAMRGMYAAGLDTSMGITIMELLEQYRTSASKKLESSSWKTYEQVLALFDEYLRKREMLDDDVTLILERQEEIFEDFFKALKLGMRGRPNASSIKGHARTRNKYRAIIKALLSYGEEKNFYKLKQWGRELRDETVPRSSPRSLSDQTVREMLRGARMRRYGRRYYTLIMLLVRTGGRIGEITGIKLEDIDWGKSVLKVYGKYHPRPLGRTIAMTSRLRKMLHDYVGWLYPSMNFTQLGKNYLFYAQDPKIGLSTRAVEDVFDRISRDVRLNIPPEERDNIMPHALRHTFARTLLDAGVDIVTVKELLGQKDIRATQIYTQPRTEHLLRATEKLDDHIDQRW